MWHSPRAQLLKFAYALSCLVIGWELVTWCDWQLVIGRTHRLHLDLSCQLFCLDNVGALRLIQEAVVLMQVILRRKQEKFHFHFLYYVIWIKLRKWKIRNHFMLGKEIRINFLHGQVACSTGCSKDLSQFECVTVISRRIANAFALLLN